MDRQHERQPGAATIASNKLNSNTTLADGYIFSVPDITHKDQFVEWTVDAVGANSAFLDLRYTDINNKVSVRQNGTNIEIYRRVASSYSSFHSVNYSLVAGDVIRLEAREDNCFLFKNGALQSGFPMAIGAILNGTKVGLNPRTALYTGWMRGVKFGSITPPYTAPPDPTGKAKIWTGTAWVAKPVKVWSGSAWVAKPVKFWTGTAWKTTGTAAAAWTPAAIAADLTTWLQADTLPGVEGEWVANWPDSGPDGLGFNRSSPTNNPLLRKNYLNGKSVVFLGNTPMETSASVTFNDFAVYAVWMGLENAQTVRLLDYNYLNWWIGRGTDSGEGAWEFGGGIAQDTSPYGDFLRGIDGPSWHISVFSRVGAVKRVRDNGGPNEITVPATTGTTSPNQIYIAVDSYHSLYTQNLYLAELLILDSNVETNMTKIEGYLAWKWGLQAKLPAGHPYKGAAP